MNTEPKPSLLQYTHVMIDLETLNNTPDSPVLSIGLVPFNPDSGLIMGKEDCFHAFVSLDDELKLGAEPSASTFMWWLAQDEDARRKLVEKQEVAEHAFVVAMQMVEFLKENTNVDTVRMWGNGASFDLPILENFLRRQVVDIPWKFYNIRCFRTLKNMQPAGVGPLTKPAVAHDALEDAYAQAINAIRIIQALPIVAEAV